MGIAGADYGDMLPILRRRLADLPNLQIVLLEADNISLIQDVFRRRDYYSLYAWGLQREDLPLGTWERIQQAVLEFPWVAPFAYSRRLTPRAWAWRADPGDWLDYPGLGFVASQAQVVPANGGAVRIREHDREVSSESIARNRAAFVELIRLLKARGIRVVLITLPHHEGYACNASPRWREIFSDLLDAGRAALGDQFLWWNMDGLPALDDRDFHDGHHLNARGAAQLSKWIKARLVENGMWPN